jgi:lipoyl(octanoyl) transferase
MQLPVLDLGRLDYARAFARQTAELERVIASRDTPAPCAGVILLVEHDPPVITISNRPAARQHLIATDQQLAAAGVTVAPTDRGGDITYHGPGQLVLYPILDLNAFRLGLHDYMRLLEDAVIDTCAAFGLHATRDAGATGVWIPPRDASAAMGAAKVCAMGVRVRRWVSMHGLAINVTTNLAHFDLIVPCGLAGRAVTSLQRELGERCPSMTEVKRVLGAALRSRLEQRVAGARAD